MTGEAVLTGDALLESMGYSTGWSNTSMIIYVVIAFGLMFGIFFYQRYATNKKAQAWLEKNPGASKINIKTSIFNYLLLGLYHEGPIIHTVDEKEVVKFYEGLKEGFYLTPGSHVVSVTFQKKRPGIFHKSVTTTYGPSNQEVTAEANKSYDFSFNSSKTTYSLKERK